MIVLHDQVKFLVFLPNINNHPFRSVYTEGEIMPVHQSVKSFSSSLYMITDTTCDTSCRKGKTHKAKVNRRLLLNSESMCCIIKEEQGCPGRSKDQVMKMLCLQNYLYT